MPYNSTTKIVSKSTVNGVTYGVSWRDVQQALGVTDTDEHALCQSGRVRMLSRYKPIVDTLNGQSRTKATLSNNDFMLRNWGFKIPKFQGTALDSKAKAIVKGGAFWSTFTNAQMEAANIGNGWVYPAPVQGENFARISDFDGYDHSKPSNYQHNTLVITNEYKVIAGVNKITNDVQISFDLSPYSPRNFKSLEGYRLAVAFWYQVERTNNTPYESDTYFYIGSGSSHVISLSATDQTAMTLTVPQAMFQALLNKAINGAMHAYSATFYAVGFFAPGNYGGYDNITGSSNANSLSDLIPLPGLGYETFQLQNVAGTGDYDVCLLAVSGTYLTVPVSGSKNGFTAKILSVTNNYDLINTDTGGQIYFMPAYLRYTYDVFKPNGDKDTDLSQSSLARFGNTSGSIDVSNTVRTNGVVTHKTTDISMYNFTSNIPVFNTGALSGYTVVVKLWYLTYNSDPGTNNIYRQVGQFAVVVDGEMSRDV